MTSLPSRLRTPTLVASLCLFSLLARAQASSQTPMPTVPPNQPATVVQQITVTATRSSLDLPATANTLYSITTQQLNEYPATELDDKLRQQAGFELFLSLIHILGQSTQLPAAGTSWASRLLNGACFKSKRTLCSCLLYTSRCV